MELNLEQKREILASLCGNTFAYGVLIGLSHYDIHWTTYCGKKITAIITTDNKLVALKDGYIEKSAAQDAILIAKTREIIASQN